MPVLQLDAGVAELRFSLDLVEPHAVQEHVPMWIGGRTRRSLRRATTHGDGWVPFGLSLEELSALLGSVERIADRMKAYAAALALDPEFDMTDCQVPGRVIGHTHAEEINVALDVLEPAWRALDVRLRGGPPLDALTKDRFRNPRGSLGIGEGQPIDPRVIGNQSSEAIGAEQRARLATVLHTLAQAVADLRGAIGFSSFA